MPSHYKELHHFENEDQDLVMDEITGVICLKKTLTYFDTAVFEYLKDHSNLHIPKVYDYYEEDSKLILIEEHIKGQTLEDWLKSDDVSDKLKLNVMDQICDGIIFLHNAPSPIIHRDIKPSNIMITSDGIVKIIDYDAAKTYKQGEIRDTVLLGTRAIAAPEQYGFSQSDPRTDIFALGMLLREIFPESKHYSKIADKATCMDPKDRYESVKAFKQALHVKPYLIYSSVLILSLILLFAITALAAAINSCLRKDTIPTTITNASSGTDKLLLPVIGNMFPDTGTAETTTESGEVEASADITETEAESVESMIIPERGRFSDFPNTPINSISTTNTAPSNITVTTSSSATVFTTRATSTTAASSRTSSASSGTTATTTIEETTTTESSYNATYHVIRYSDGSTQVVLYTVADAIDYFVYTGQGLGSYSPYSYTELISELKFYRDSEEPIFDATDEEIIAGVNDANIDFNYNAILQVQHYNEAWGITVFSPADCRKILVDYEYTTDNIDYFFANCNIDWNAMAVEYARKQIKWYYNYWLTYQQEDYNRGAMTLIDCYYSDCKSDMSYNGFTEEQINYAYETLGLVYYGYPENQWPSWITE